MITERHFGPAAALVGGLLYVFFRPLVMHEGILLRDATISVMALGLVYVTDLALERRKPWWWALVGFVLGLALLMKGIFPPISRG